MNGVAVEELGQATDAEALNSATAGFARHAAYRYHWTIHSADFEAFIQRTIGANFNQMTRDMVDRPEVQALFAVERAAEGFDLDQPMTLHLYCRGRA